ncbi:hypothetical protein SOV_15780 [Sporomusa ovata DSM 2662]|uniref:VrlQ n=1 Tax=Sporomusa ovata TaxID=2378 RepID=A0A0U1KYX5_9FIRM|nr:hypothetical protein [Sporomusa ovata]EQB29182.1 VrlQ family protein [Sporomusa ovata DSM 2662]CQR72617.1 VrlQ [Sporomusa ovata]
MGVTRYTQIGLDRLIRLEWLDKTADLVLAGNSAQDIKVRLQEDLQASFVSANTEVRGSIDKTITILMKVWLNVPADLKLLQVDGIDLLKNIPRQDHLAIHWGMLMAGYPFWASVATQTGRLLKLQGAVVAAHVQRRVREHYGERETVARRVRYVLRSFLDWGVLKETEERGVYDTGLSSHLDEPRLIEWLIRASLHAKESGSASLKDLINSPSLFPFYLAPIQAERISAETAEIDILRHGLDDDLIVLKKRRI